MRENSVGPRLIFSSLALILAVSTASGQSTRTWTGNASPDNNWTTDTNWDVVHPVSGDTALFNSAGNGNTTISLAGAAQPIKVVQFDTASAAAYTIGANSGDALNFDSGGSLVVTATDPATQTINAGIQANGTLAINNSSTAGVLALNSVISGTGATLNLGGATGGITQLNAQNSYTGTTNINVNGNTIQIGSSSNSGPFTAGPFGTSTVVTTTGTNSPMQAINADQTIANPFTLNFGFTVSAATTPHNLTFTGPFNYPSASSRTITINAPGTTTTLGSAASPSTITLSSTASIPLIMDVVQNATLVINDVIQDNGATAGLVTYNPIGNNTPQGIMQINSANTYSGATAFGNQTSGTFNALTVLLNVSTVGSPGSITSGPFGKGTVTFSNTNAPVNLQPFGADRTLANAFTLNAGFFTSNPSAVADPSGPHNLTLTGPITLGTTGRTVTNNLVAASTLTLGAAGSPSTLTLGNTLGFQTQPASGAGGGNTVINDLISSTSGGAGLTVQNGAKLTLTNANTYTGTTTVQITSGTNSPTLLVNNTTGSGTGTGLVNVKAGILGGTGIIVPTAAVTGPIPGQVTIGSAGILAPGNNGIGTLTVDSSSANGPAVVFSSGATISEELNTSHASDTLALIHAAPTDIVFNSNTVNFSDLSGGSLTSGSYPIFTADAAGAFSGLTLDGSGNITAGLSIGTGLSAYPSAVLQEVGNNIVLTIPAAALLGDFNNDGKVDAGDYAVWRKNEIANAALPNDNGLTTQADRYSLWRANFGNGSPGAGSSLHGGAVPEPAALSLLGIAFCAFVTRRHKS